MVSGIEEEQLMNSCGSLDDDAGLEPLLTINGDWVGTC